MDITTQKFSKVVYFWTLFIFQNDDIDDSDDDDDGDGDYNGDGDDIYLVCDGIYLVGSMIISGIEVEEWFGETKVHGLSSVINTNQYSCRFVDSL